MTTLETSTSEGWGRTYTGYITEESLFHSHEVSEREAISYIAGRLSALPETRGMLVAVGASGPLFSLVTVVVRVANGNGHALAWECVALISRLMAEAIRGIATEAPPDVFARAFEPSCWSFETMRNVMLRQTEFAVRIRVPRVVTASYVAPVGLAEFWREPQNALPEEAESGSHSTACDTPSEVSIWERRPLKRVTVDESPLAGADRPTRRFGRFKK